MGPLFAYRAEIQQICNRHKVRTLFVFGSVLGPRFTETSDIDLIVDFLPIDLMDYADNYFSLKNELEDLFSRPIDLLENQSVRNPYFRQSVEKQKQILYGNPD